MKPFRIFRKTISLICIIVLLITLNGCGLSTITSNEIRKDYVLEDSLAILPEKQNTFTEQDRSLLNNMELALKNDYLELYIGQEYDIAVFNKLSGTIVWSNPVFHDLTDNEKNRLTDSTKRLLFSQVMIEYYNNEQQKMTMSSYPDSHSSNKNQVDWEVKDDILTVTYGFGTNVEKTNLFVAFSKESYEHYLSILDEMMANEDITMLDYRNFVNNYTKIDYSQLSNEQKASYTETYPNLPELETIYIVKPVRLNNTIDKILDIYNLIGIDEEAKIAEAEKIGTFHGDLETIYFEIPLQYQLHGADLMVSVDVEAITKPKQYYLTKVHLLPSFSASTQEDEGYLFLPDGSGTIIENKKENYSMVNTSIPFYGHDYGLDYDSYSDLAIDSTFPVFGIKLGDKSTFAIVENGESIGGVSAHIATDYMNYNIVYPYFTYDIIDRFGIEGVSYAFYTAVPQIEYVVRYHFLEGEDSDYSGMARYYRSYLEQKGHLNKNINGGHHLPLDIQLIGSIDKTVNYFGVPKNTSYPITTFSQAYEIMDILHEKNISNVDVVYTGMLNGGYNFKSVKKLDIQKELGGVRGYNDLNDKFMDYEYDLHTDIDFLRFYKKGNGIRKQSDVVRYLNKNAAYLSAINPGTNSRTYRGASYLVNPLLFKEIAESFLIEYEEIHTKSLYLSSIGTYLNGNYSNDKGVTRQTSKILIKELLDILREENFNMKFDMGNAYVLPFAKSLINVPTTSSHQRIESYTVPFVGMVLKGYLPFTAKSINQSSNSDKALLEAIESGAGLNYLLMYEQQLSLVDTNQIDLYSINYELWMNDIITVYQKLNSDLGYLADVSIHEHHRLTDKVNMVTYEDGSKIYINYGKASFDTGKGLVEAMSYLVVK